MHACTTIAAGRATTGTGCVIVGHNEDFNGLRMDHGMVPARDWPEGAFLPKEPGRASIPQVRHTHAFYWSEAIRRDMHPNPGCDSALNEHGVFITMNNGGKARADETGDGRSESRVRGQILRIVMERARSSREAAAIASGLLKRHGMARPEWGCIWTVADKDEAWIIQSAGVRSFAVLRVPDDCVAVIPNVFTVRKIPAPGFDAGLSSDDLKDGTDDFSRRFQHPEWFMHPHSMSRFRLATAFLAGSAARPAEASFALKPEITVSADAVKRVLSLHVADGDAAHVDDAGPICRWETMESTVCRFAGDPSETTLFVALGSPCSHGWNEWKPFSPGFVIPRDTGMDDPARRLDEQFAGRKYPQKGAARQ